MLMFSDSSPGYVGVVMEFAAASDGAVQATSVAVV